MRKTALLLGLLTAFWLNPAALLADTATVSWNPNPEADVVGYVVLYGTQSGIYTLSQIGWRRHHGHADQSDSRARPTTSGSRRSTPMA